MSLDSAREILFDHAQNPRNLGRLTGKFFSGECINPVCGDRIVVFLRTDGEIITDLRIEAQGCSLSRASASLLTEFAQQKQITAMRAHVERFQHALNSSIDSDWPSDFEDLHALSYLRVGKVRIACGLIAWQACEKALAQIPSQLLNSNGESRWAND